jgi:hypothetical protein
MSKVDTDILLLGKGESYFGKKTILSVTKMSLKLK